MKMTLHVLLFLVVPLSLSPSSFADPCVECHLKVTPGIVADWELSKHSTGSVECSVCHGEEHQSAEDIGKAKIPTPETCGQCHEQRVAEFKKGKHAVAWAAMKALPTFHRQPADLTDGMKGCGGCHKIGVKTEKEIAGLQKSGRGFGIASCDACHTRHTFSITEARQPQACQTCHTGFDHSQWEMYSGSKHGVRALMKQSGVLPDKTPAPTCQSCHMREGNHEVRTAWGFLAVRLPMPDDRQWAADRTVILKALGVLTPEGKPTPRLELVKGAGIARLTQEEWEAERGAMIRTCNQCHALEFAREELAKGDRMIREADRLMAEGIQTVAGLYRDGVLKKSGTYATSFPDLLTFHDAPTVIEQKLFVMFLEHRMRVFQGTFHANPDYALWYGWSAMKQTLAEIKEEAASMRGKRGRK